MNDAAQIRRCSGALDAKHPRSQSPFLSPPPARGPNPKISNRESLRRVRAVNRLCDCKAVASARRNDDLINVTQTKQTSQPYSNRELEALFSGHDRSAPRPRKLPTHPKNTTTDPSALLRLKPNPILCFVRVKDSFNRTMLRLNNPFSTPENTAPLQIRRRKTATIATSTPQSLFRLERTSTAYFQQLKRNLNEPMFRLERHFFTIPKSRAPVAQPLLAGSNSSIPLGALLDPGRNTNLRSATHVYSIDERRCG